MAAPVISPWLCHAYHCENGAVSNPLFLEWQQPFLLESLPYLSNELL